MCPDLVDGVFRSVPFSVLREQVDLALAGNDEHRLFFRKKLLPQGLPKHGGSFSTPRLREFIRKCQWIPKASFWLAPVSPALYGPSIEIEEIVGLLYHRTIADRSFQQAEFWGFNRPQWFEEN